MTAIARYSGHLDLFVIGTDNRIYSTWWHEGSNWAAWFNVSGGIGQAGGQVAAISRFTDHIDLFTVGSDGRRLQHVVGRERWMGGMVWAGCHLADSAICLAPSTIFAGVDMRIFLDGIRLD